MIPLATAKICEDKLTPNKNCQMLTPSLTCTAYTFNIFNETSTVLKDSTLTLVNGTIYKFNFNESKGSYIVQLCDNSTREIIVEGEDEMPVLAIVIGEIIFILCFLAIAFILKNIYMKLITLMFVFGFNILLWATMIQIAEDILVENSILILMQSGWKLVLYSHIVFIGLIFLFLTYELLMTLSKIHKAKY